MFQHTNTAMPVAQKATSRRRRSGWAVAGGAIGDPEAWGLDAAFPAGYVALVVPHLRDRAGRVAAAAGAAISLVLIPLAPAGLPIVAAALGVVPALLFAPRTGRGVHQ